ncbi:hypothetical protein MUK42_27901 [Musa troglodytarum]|uniref:Uncharacterized protein n=1 Tax=Musa troglodytarum TaxID=320322 RepID=A0A9E7G6L2_9LILI|nr:hypothetical protein MUK42_27901 [Musa troglodytarum]
MHFMEKGIRGMARRQRSDFLRHVIEKVSLMSNSWASSFISRWELPIKAVDKASQESSMLFKPNDIPGHILLPALKGKNSKLVPLKSTMEFLLSNLSGSNSVALSQCRGSLPKAQTFTNTRLLWYPVTKNLARPGTRGAAEEQEGAASESP